MTEEKKEDGAVARTLEYAFESYTSEDWTKLLESISEFLVKTRSASMAEKRTLSRPVFFLIAGIMAGVFGLVCLDKLEGDVLVSIGGMIVGYLLSFLGESFGTSE